MKQFEQNKVYVDPETGAVLLGGGLLPAKHGIYTNILAAPCLNMYKLVSTEKQWNLTKEEQAFRAKACHFYDVGFNRRGNIAMPYESMGRDVFKDFRPWQGRDEPTSYDEARWGKVKIGQGYKTILDKVYYVPTCVSEDTIHIIKNWNETGGVFWQSLSIGRSQFNESITRPAFPQEVDGIELPKFNGDV